MPKPDAALPSRTSREQVEEFTRAIRVVVDRSLWESVRSQPQVLLEALTPGLLPTIKRMVAIFFSELVESVQNILEKSFSVTSLRYRFEAFRTGKSYAEMALLHSLLYRVEEVLLIDYKSGLLWLDKVRGMLIRWMPMPSAGWSPLWLISSRTHFMRRA